MIKLQIIGSLGKDCVVKEVGGKNVMNFSVAHSEKWKDNQGNQKEKTTWVECAYWSDKTAVAQYLTKGKTVYVEGAPEADAYANREGQPTGTLRCRVMNIQLLGGGDKPMDGQAQQQQRSTPQQTTIDHSASGGQAIDDLPF